MSLRNYSSVSPNSTLASGISAGDTSVTLTHDESFFPTVPFTLILDVDTVNEEIVDVTAKSGSVYTITRAVDGTTAKAHNAGAAAVHGVSGRDFAEAVASEDVTSMVVVSQAEYDALTPDPTTFYVIL